MATCSRTLYLWVIVRLRGCIDESGNSLKPRAHLPVQMPCISWYIVL